MTRWSEAAGVRLRRAIRESAFTIDSFAAAAGTSRTTLYRFFTGAEPDANQILVMADLLNVRPDYLTGDLGEDVQLRGATVDVPVYSLEVAAGAGRDGTAGNFLVNWPLPTDWVEANLGDLKGMQGFRVRGDSQYPELADEDIVIIDTKSRRPNGDLHVVRVDDDLRIKRLEQDGTTIRLTSNNPLYPDEKIDLRGDADRFEVIGSAVMAIKLL